MFHNVIRILGVVGVMLLLSPAAFAVGGVSLEPTVVHLTMRPGEAWKGTVSVTNNDDHAVKFVQTTANVSRSTEGDTITVSQDIAARLGTLASWLNPDAASFVLAAHEQSVRTFSISVPENATPGTHRALLILAPAPATQQPDTVSTSAAVGLGVDLTIVGQTNHRVLLQSAGIGARIATKPPVTVVGEVVNSGNTLPTIIMHADIGRIWGGARATIALMPENSSQKVAPGSQTRFKGVWNGVGFIPAGIFKVRIIAEDSSGTYEATRYFVLIPWQVIVGVLVAGLVVFFGRRFGPRILHRRMR